MTIKDASLAPQKTGIKNNKNIVLDTLIQVALLLSSGLHLKENEFKRWVLQSTLSLKKIQIPENQMIIIGSKTLTITELEDNSLFTFITTTVDSDSRIKNFSCVKI